MDHDSRVDAICQAVRARPPFKQLTVRKQRPGHTPHDYRYKSGKHAVDVTALRNVLEVDVEQRLAVCEGEVNMGQLCAATLPLKLVPAVVPELETFTVSGLINGLGLETSSHRHGLFPMNVPWFDVVLADGERVRASEHEHESLFTALPGSYGSLGIVTRAAVQLVPAASHVHSRYRLFSRVGEYVNAFGHALEAHDFVEGFIMGPRAHVLVCSDFSEPRAELPLYHAMRSCNLWYYEHAERMAARGGEDLVPTYEYLFRHMRSLLWVSRFANFLHLPMTKLGRFLIDRRVMHELYQHGLTSSIPHAARERSVVMQDVAVSLDRLEEGIEYAKEHFALYPFWNCAVGHAQRGPYAPGGRCEMHFIGNHRLPEPARKSLEQRTRFMVDIGLYGEPRRPGFRHRSAIRALQRFADVPALWGVCYLSHEEFRSLYAIDAYEAVRRRYRADSAFPHIADKVLSEPSDAKELGPSPLWRAAAFVHRLLHPGRGL